MHFSKVEVSILQGFLCVDLVGEIEYDSLSWMCGLGIVVGWLIMLGSLEGSDLGSVLYLCLSRFLSRFLSWFRSLGCLGGELDLSCRSNIPVGDPNLKVEGGLPRSLSLRLGGVGSLSLRLGGL